ncbi:MAG: hypothetical protein ACK6CX_08310, partial [Pseudanabaena sp.]
FFFYLWHLKIKKYKKKKKYLFFSSFFFWVGALRPPNTITKKITLQHYHMSFAVFGLSPI